MHEAGLATTILTLDWKQSAASITSSVPGLRLLMVARSALTITCSTAAVVMLLPLPYSRSIPPGYETSKLSSKFEDFEVALRILRFLSRGEG